MNLSTSTVRPVVIIAFNAVVVIDIVVLAVYIVEVVEVASDASLLKNKSNLLLPNVFYELNSLYLNLNIHI
ncbi:uncharacterized protein OCT59_001277 [Rhizophagus irregularis]|uniref:uncharacterized protein n=1 Tax=Rhizophagus irregularis TaxID=588596 RepID=UPI0019F32F28|nr:hypothetical protein OCT59_001277 [Rhizophagus irregularis]GET61355.1 hypothetical protein RIR_jg28048.t1 [Rhizophagus irregularis DAOM 181602=DAOM 197198]